MAWSFKLMKLRNKFILWLAPAILVPLIASVLFSIFVFKDKSAQLALTQMQTERAKVEDFFQNQMTLR